MKKKNIIRKCRSFLCLVLAVSMLTAGCGLFGDESNESSVESGESGESLYGSSSGDKLYPDESVNNDPTATPTEEPTPTVSHENMYRNELSNEWMDDSYMNKRPIAIMYNNSVHGVPQCGISKAEVVYECIAEGGVTRLMGIIKEYDKLTEFGSIRSARSYFVQWCMEYNAVLCHCGGPQIYVADWLKKVDRLDGTSLVGTIYYRTADRVSPHNVFGSGELLLQGFEKYKISRDYTNTYKGEHFVFADESTPVELENGRTANKVSVPYHHNKPYFEYDSTTGLYKRFQFDGPQVDGTTNEQITFKNIIIQYAVGRTLDGTAYQEYDVIGSGKGVYITNGKAIDITWKKTGDYLPTRYYDASGKEITLNTGKTMICVCPPDMEKLNSIS